MEATATTGQGRIIVVYGLNATGKTLMAERMRREMKSDSVRYVAFCDTYGTATDRSYYLQQRWNQHDIDEETPTVAQSLERSFLLSGPDTAERRQLQRHLYSLMGMEPLSDKIVIALSSGELRKMQLVKTLMANPRTLILDNPFIGLDIEARTMLSEQLQQLRQQGMTLYLLVARPNEIPEFADEVRGERLEVRGERLPAQTDISHTSHLSPLTSEIVLLRDVTIRYGNRTILDRLSWTIRQGEHWALQGPRCRISSSMCGKSRSPALKASHRGLRNP